MSDFVRARPRAAFVCAGLCLLALTGCGSQLVKQQQAQDDLAAAMQQAQIGKTQEARRWADRAIAAAPHDLNTYVTASSAQDDTTPLGIVDAGNGDHGVFTSVGDDADVVAYMTQAAAKFPTNPLPLMLKEQAQGRLGDTAGQRTTAARLASLLEQQMSAPGHQINAGLINLLAQAYWDAGDAVKGAMNYQRVIDTYPHDPGAIDARNGLAYAYAVANDTAHLPTALALATAALSQAQKQGGTDQSLGAIRDTLGWVQYRQGDYKDALVNIQKGVNGNPRSAETRYHLAMVYKALGDTGAARIEFGYAVRLSQGYAAAQREMETLPQPAPQPLPPSSSA